MIPHTHDEIQYAPDDTPLPSLDPSWYILQSTYSLCLTIIQTQPRLAASHLNSTFLLHFAHNYHSHDPREQKQITLVLYRIYASLPECRDSVKFAIQMCLQEYMEGEGCAEGVGEALGFYLLILKGMAIPIRDEHRVFLKKYLLALIRLPRIEAIFANWEKCLKQYIEKDPSFAIPIVSTLLRYWPRGNLNKEIAFVTVLEKCVVIVDDQTVLNRICEPIRKRLYACVMSENVLVAERVLRLFCEEGFLPKLLTELNMGVFQSMLESVEQQSWSAGVKKQCRKVRELCDCNSHVL